MIITDFQFDNIIAGKKINLSNNYFEAKSPFYSDFKFDIANSGVLDVTIAISKAKTANIDCDKLEHADKCTILKKASKKIKFSEGEIKAIVRMTGMPIKYVKKYLAEIPGIMVNFPILMQKRYGIIDGKFATHLHKHKDYTKVEFREPITGFAYAVTPANDPRAVALVATTLVALGVPGIIKPSKLDALTANKVINSIIDAGYPPNGLNAVYYNSSDPSAQKHNFKICDNAHAIWPYGDDNTVDKILRLEYRKILNLERFLDDKKIQNFKNDSIKMIDELKKSEADLNNYIEDQTIDHFNSKIVLRHSSGRCAGILDKKFNLETAKKIILNSSMNYPIGCNSMKSLFVIKESYSKILELLKENIQNLADKIGDPLDKNTEVGYIDPLTVSYMLKRISELKKMGLIEVIAGGQKISDMQVTPLLVTTEDVNSEILINETPAYILGLKKCDSLNDAISDVNLAANKGKKLVVSILTKNPQKIFQKIKAHHIKVNNLTTDLDGIVHEGNDYVMQLTKPIIVHTQKKLFN